MTVVGRRADGYWQTDDGLFVSRVVFEYEEAAARKLAEADRKLQAAFDEYTVTVDAIRDGLTRLRLPSDPADA